jgi:exosortase/archaeosortase family protein
MPLDIRRLPQRAQSFSPFHGYPSCQGRASIQANFPAKNRLNFLGDIPYFDSYEILPLKQGLRFISRQYRASWTRRIVIVLCGALIAFLCNVGRTFILTAVAAKDGIETISNWHDPLGFTVLAICLLLVWGLARLVSGPLPKLLPSKASPAPDPFPWRWATGLGAWVLFTVVGAEVWYRSQETKAKHHWSVVWPVFKRDFSDVTIPKREADALACDERRGAAWANDDGSLRFKYSSVHE